MITVERKGWVILKLYSQIMSAIMKTSKLNYKFSVGGVGWGGVGGSCK